MTSKRQPQKSHMSKDEFRKAIQDLEMKSLTEAAQLLGCDVRTVRRWANGYSPISKTTAMLLMIMLRGGIGPKSLEKLLH